MISKKKVERGVLSDDPFFRLTIHGFVDDIMELKTPVKLEDIFSRDEASRKVILIEGAPGSGKTTLAWYICQKWESGELFQEFDLVVLVQLRDSDIQSALSIYNLLPCSEVSQLHNVVSEIRSTSGKGMLWVMDGWDELPPPLQQSSLFHQLISPPRVCPFTESAVLVTSRPISSANLHPLVSSRVEVIGFTEAQIKEYFKESLNHDDQAVQKLEHHLSRNPVIESSCYLPLNAAIIVHLFLALGCTLPTSLHMTFCLIIANCVFRYLKDRANRGSEMPPLSSLGHNGDIRLLFPPDIQSHFRNICHLAYIGIHENRLTFSANDLQQYGLSAPLCSLGLLQETETFVSVGRSVSYNFLHLSMQELLAAFHISEMPPDEQIKTFQSLMGHPRFVSVLQFYAGITKLQTPGIHNVIGSVVRRVMSYEEKARNLVSVIKCLLETQDVQLCLSVAEMLQWNLGLWATTLSPTDCLSIGYFSSCVCYNCDSQHEFHMGLGSCSLDDNCVKHLMRGVMSADRSIQSGTRSTCTLHLDLQLNNIYSSGTHSIAEALRCCTLISTLVLYGNQGIEEDGFRHIAVALVSNSSLVKLNASLCSIRITDHSGPVVTEMLRKNKSLQNLNLRYNPQLSDSGALYIAEGLNQNIALRKLNLHVCGITAMGAKTLAQTLAINTSLQSLDLSYNRLTGVGVGALAESLKHNVNLKELRLSNCTREVESFADLMSVTESLKQGSYNRESDNIARSLADALKVNRSLQHLTVNSSGISDRGVEELAEMLVVNNTLEELDLSFNDIQGPGLLKLGACLKTNRTLSVLGLTCRHKSLRFMEHDQSVVFMKKFVLNLADNCCLRALYLNKTHQILVRQDVELINTTRRQRGHPELKLDFRIRAKED